MMLGSGRRKGKGQLVAPNEGTIRREDLQDSPEQRVTHRVASGKSGGTGRESADAGTTKKAKKKHRKKRGKQEG
jgi:hypothetical protein